MTIKDIRRGLGLTQKEFAEKYHIPLQTVKQWESDPESTSYRRPPDYVFYMLGRLGDIDRIVEYSGSISREENIMRAAERSRNNAKHWLRYLRKEFVGGKSRLTSEQVAVILNSGRLSMYQRISLLRAIEPGTPTNEYVLSLNERAKTPMMDKLLKEYNERKQQKPEYIAGMKLIGAREQDMEDVAAILRKLDIKDPVAFLDKVEGYGLGYFDESLLLEAFGTAYGMEWLEKYFIAHEEEITARVRESDIAIQ